MKSSFNSAIIKAIAAIALASKATAQSSYGGYQKPSYQQSSQYQQPSQNQQSYSQDQYGGQADYYDEAYYGDEAYYEEAYYDDEAYYGDEGYYDEDYYYENDDQRDYNSYDKGMYGDQGSYSNGYYEPNQKYETQYDGGYDDYYPTSRDYYSEEKTYLPASGADLNKFDSNYNYPTTYEEFEYDKINNAYPYEDNNLPKQYQPYEEEPKYKADEYDYFGNKYDDDYDQFVTQLKDRYEPTKIEQVDTWTDYQKFPKDANFKNKVTPINKHIVTMPTTDGGKERYGFKMTDYVFMQEEYEHNLRIQSRLMVVIEAFKEAQYFMKRKQDATEEIVMQNNHNVRVHQGYSARQREQVIAGFKHIKDCQRRTHTLFDSTHKAEQYIH